LFRNIGQVFKFITTSVAILAKTLWGAGPPLWGAGPPSAEWGGYNK